jgi:hypothetical protein
LYPATFDISTSKDKTVSFRFRKTGDTAIQKVELEINGVKVSSQIRQDDDGLYSIDHIFKMKGKYVVHVLLDSNYIFTYTVTVNKPA